jgi:histidyl-tRNA synthetase
MAQMAKQKKQRVKPRLLKGMQDSWPELSRARRKMLAKIAEVCERSGFLPFDTPTMEAQETLLGPEPNPDQLATVFHFTNLDDEDVALRYEMTASLARVVSQYQMELPKPFRRYQVGNAFRWDKPEPGRFREFLQFDVDIVGSSSMAADAEIVAVIDTILRELGIEGYLIRVSNRKLLNALGIWIGADTGQARDIYRVIDKLDKFDRERIRKELGPGLVDESGDPIKGLGLNDEQIERIDSFLDLPNAGNTAETIAAVKGLLGDIELAVEALNEIEQVMEFIAAFGVESNAVMFDLHLARGLGYYTGPVFEVVLRDLPSFGSIFGGGRYDGLVERFLGEGQGIPATGASVGLDRLLAALAEIRKRQGLEEQEPFTSSQVLVTVMDRARLAEYIAMVCELREAGISSEVYLGSGNLGKQLKYADRLGIPLAVIAGEDEFANGQVSVKDLELGRRIAEETSSREEWQELKQQFTINRTELVEVFQQRLDRNFE